MNDVPPRDELVRLITNTGIMMNPLEILPRIGGAQAADDLLDLLQNYPDPVPADAEKKWSQIAKFHLTFRKNVINLLAELRDPRAVEPLVKCYKAYRAFEELLIEVAEQSGVPVPPRYLASEELFKLYKTPASISSITRSAAYGRFREKIAGTCLEASLGSEDYLYYCLLNGADQVRRVALRALEQVIGEGAKEFFAALLAEEREIGVRHALAFALARMGDQRGIEDLISYLQRYATAAVVFHGQIKEAIDFLCDSPDERARQALREFHRRCDKIELRNYAAAKLGLPQETNPEHPEGPKPRQPEAPSAGLPEQKSKCFIATAAYGSEDAPAVSQLRRFREQRLRPYRAGRAAIKLYEHFSPPLAEFIRPRPGLRAAVRALVLRPALWMIVSSRKRNQA